MLLLKTYRFCMRILRPNSGLTRLSFNPLINRLFSSETSPLPATMIDGTPIEIDHTDYHGRILWLFGTNDWKVSRTVNALLNPGDVMLDIGANYGTIGIIARHRVETAGHIHLFEPQPYLARRLEYALSAIQVENVTVHQVALFDVDGEMELSLSHGHSGLATLVGTVKSSNDKETEKILVPVYRTDAYIREFVSGRPFGVKIDIEGAEPHVLPGLLSFYNLKFVVFEGDRNKRDLFDIFTNHGFVIYGLCRTLFSPRVEPLHRFEDWENFHDFVAVPAPITRSSRRLRLAELARITEDSTGPDGVRGSK